MKGGWHAAIFIICVEFAQQFAFVGLSSNLITYLTNELEESIIEATKNINTWVSVSSIFPLLLLSSLTHILVASKLSLYPPSFISCFLNKAMMMDENDASSNSRNPWRLCTVTQVEQVKLILRLIPIWLCCIMFFVVQSQLVTFFPKQGSTMDRSIGPKFQIPPASLLGFIGIVMLCET
ncbi:hypothetical protein PIB30_005490 [Stylosanthes scabra]|uniref:Uncharacterized protein n=1 Tax=Stylosanthes scabra TaxID=79078 RepID=A0ABU6Z4S0_9FABA|nr:hypothetical protein [Stylosanthes scabra]